MKRYILPIAAALAFAGAASAEPITVSVPADLSTEAAKAAYTHELQVAARRACLKAVAGSILQFPSYQDCLKDAHIQILKQDRTGLFALRVASQTATKAVEVASR